jgi:uncharacterized lipoprotein YddW (UPF0748 family)
MIKCEVCGSIFLSIPGLPGVDGKSFDDHVKFCDAKDKKSKQKKKYKRREKELPEKDAEWEDFD